MGRVTMENIARARAADEAAAAEQPETVSAGLQKPKQSVKRVAAKKKKARAKRV